MGEAERSGQPGTSLGRGESSLLPAEGQGVSVVKLSVDSGRLHKREWGREVD